MDNIISEEDTVEVPIEDYIFLKKFFDKYKKIEMVQKLIKKNYYNNSELEEIDFTIEAINGILHALNDPYSTYMDRKEYNCLDLYPEEKYYGIRFQVMSDKKIVIANIIPNSEAYNKGIQVGDIIQKINNESVNFENLYTVVKLAINQNNMELDVLNDKKICTYCLQKRLEKDENKDIVIEQLSESIYYIRINVFTIYTSELFIDSIQSIINKNMQGLILDLSNNMGGIVEEAINICKYINSEGIFGYIKDNKNCYIKLEATGMSLGTPICVIVNENTGSAAELLASGLKECANAILLGKRTYGKGVMQKFYEFQDGTGLKLSVSEMYTKNMNKINNQGIEPDYLCDDESVINHAIDILSRQIKNT